MMFNPQNTISKAGYFVFSGEVEAAAHACFDKDILRVLWRGFTYHSSSLKVNPADGFVFGIGEAEIPDFEGFSYGINVEESGLRIAANNEHDLLIGFMTLIDRITADDGDDGSTVLKIACCTITEKPKIGVRMAHYCVFPETELWELEKFIRFCAVLKYSHVIVEFWGMYRYSFMKELAWPNAYTKEEITPIFAAARDMGLEIVPMFNHWGHASAARSIHGKHVVLDQNPALESYFCEHGWCWDIRKPKVRSLLAQIRSELIELCGDGKYFHIGCDEADGFDLKTKEGMDAVCSFINDTADELEACGRRPLVWGDMFVWRDPEFKQGNWYAANCPSKESRDYLLANLSKKIIINDWQYDSPNYPVESITAFIEAGFDSMICPWDRGRPQIDSAVKCAEENGLCGYVHTTWHTLSFGMPMVAVSAVRCFENRVALESNSTAAHLRKAYFVHGDQRKAGWAKYEIGVLT